MEDVTMESMEMKDRIAHIIRAKNLTAAEFALKLGIQPSNISHLLSGRNNPSLDFVRKLKETLPEYNLDWIVLGKGPITVSDPFIEPAIAGPISTMGEKEKASEQFDGGSLFSQTEDVSMPDKEFVSPTMSVLKHIFLVYSDNTFELISPR